jgi:hypothetical protein
MTEFDPLLRLASVRYWETPLGLLLRSRLTCLLQLLPVRRVLERLFGLALLYENIAPVHWNHINLTGDYSWRQNKRVEKGNLRPLRMPMA